MKKKLIAAVLAAATVASSAQAISLNDAHAKMRECYYPVSYASEASAQKHVEKARAASAHWLSGCNAKTKYIALSLPSSGWETEKTSKATVKLDGKRVIVGVSKKGFVILRNTDGKRVLIGAKERAKDICTGGLRATNAAGEQTKHRLHGAVGLTAEVLHAVADNCRLSVCWKPAKLATGYSLLILTSDPDGVGIPPKKIELDKSEDRLEMTLPCALDGVIVKPTRTGSYGAQWTSKTEARVGK